MAAKLLIVLTLMAVANCRHVFPRKIQSNVVAELEAEGFRCRTSCEQDDSHPSGPCVRTKEQGAKSANAGLGRCQWCYPAVTKGGETLCRLKKCSAGCMKQEDGKCGPKPSDSEAMAACEEKPCQLKGEKTGCKDDSTPQVDENFKSWVTGKDKSGKVDYMNPKTYVEPKTYTTPKFWNPYGFLA